MNLSEYILEINNHFSSILRMISSSNNVTLEQGKLLLCIPYDGITMTDLSKELGIDISTLTRNAQKLIDKNLIIKKNDDYDKRKIFIVLTNNGENLRELLEHSLDLFTNKLFDRINVKERETIETTLENLNWHLSCIRNIDS